MEQTSDPMRQIVDYSKPGKKAAFALDGALGAVPAEPAAPQQLPEPAPVPWSYLSDLIEQVGQAQPLTHAQQHQILIQLQHALRSADPEEREGGRYARKMFSSRDDLYADVERTLAQSELADHLGVAARLEQAARTAQRRKALVDEMTALHQAGQWHAVVAAAQELAGFDPEHPDPGGIVSDAKAKIRHADLAERYGQAWAQAAELFTEIEQQQPGYRDGAALLRTAQQQRQLAAWLAQAKAAAGHEDWDTAVTALENLCGVDPAYRDAGARLERARSARAVKQLVDEMTALHQAGRWEAVLAAAEKLAQLDPDHADPGGIVSEAQAKIGDAALAEQYAQALNHLDQHHWQQAAELAAAIEQQQPGYRDAAALLRTAQQQRQLAAWLAQAEAAAGHEDWDTAVAALENLCAVAPAYRDAGTRLERARSALSVKQRRSLVDEMTALHRAGRWEAVLAAAEKLAQLDPDHADPGGIVSDAQAKIRDAPLSALYAQALNHLDQHHWQQAAELAAAIEQQQPGYRDAAALVKDAEQQRQLAAWLDQAKAAAGHEDWTTAVTALENLCAVAPAYRDAGARLERARSALSVKQRRSLVDEMTALHRAGRWEAVLAVAEKLAQLDPDHPDPDGIVSDAQAKIGDAVLAEQYAQALNHLDQQHWRQAAELAAEIEQQQPGYRDAAALLRTARQNLRKTATAKQQATTHALPPPQTTTPADPEKTTPYPQKTTTSPAEKEAAPAALEPQSASLTHEQQREIIDRLQRALASADPQNRQVARHLLDRFSARQDLYQDISETVAQWCMELPTIQGVQRPHPPQVPKAARYSGWVTLPRRLPSIPVVVAVAAVVVAVILVGVLIARDSGSISKPATSETKTPATSEIKTPATSEIKTPSTSQSSVDPSSPASDNAVAQGALQGFLLSPQQINTALGATGMTVTGSSVMMSVRSAEMEPKECLAIDGSTQARVYAGSDFTAERGQTLQEGNNYAAEQAVVLFPSAQQADAFFATSAQQWPACHQYTHLWPKTQWTVGAISNTNGTLSTTATQQNANSPSAGCGRALASRNNVVIDVTTCSANPADSAVTIANQIAAKVPI